MPLFKCPPLCFSALLLSCMFASTPACSGESAAKKGQGLSEGTSLYDNRQMQELEKFNDQLTVVTKELVPLAKGMEDLRHDYAIGADPRPLTETRKALREQFKVKLDRFDAISGDIERLKKDWEEKKVESMVLQAITRRDLDTERTKKQWSGYVDKDQPYQLNKIYREHMEALKNQEDAEYEEVLKSFKRKQYLKLGLGGGIGVLIVFFSIVRRRMRVLAQPGALPAASGASASYVLLGGTFRLEREWGKDRLGVYYGALDIKKSVPVLIWLLREDAGFTPAGAKAAAAAAQRAAAVRHPGIAGIRAILQEGDRLCLVLDAMEGSPLNSLLGEGKRASLATAVGLVSQASAALNAAHAGRVLHGRLRPSDIALSEDGKAKVHMLGVPQEESEAHMAPEQAGGALLPASDVFSLAACAYEFLVGVPAFPGPDHGEQKRRMLCTPPSQAAPGLPRALDEIFRKAFFPDPVQRYRSCGEFASAMEAVWAKEKRKRSGREG